MKNTALGQLPKELLPMVLDKRVLRNNMNPVAPFHLASLKMSMILIDRILPQRLKLIVNDKSAKYIAEMVAGRYVESNGILSEFTQEDLASYG